MLPSIDHLILLVHDLDTAVDDFTRLGFVVQSRADTSSHGTLFRFIVFADGSYLLLTQFTSSEVAAKHRLGPDIAAGEGFADWCFSVPDLAPLTARMAQAGAPSRGPVSVQNTLADGRDWGLELLMTGKGTDGDDSLPFVVSDTMGREARVPAYMPHPNGVLHIAGIRATSATPGQSAAALALILGVTASGTTIETGQGALEFLGAADATPPGRPRGGLYEITLAVSGAAEGGQLDPALCHGARLLTCPAA